MEEEKGVDRFAFIDIAAGNIPSSQLHLIHTTTTPLLNDHSLPPPPPADDAEAPILTSSSSLETTIQPEPEPVTAPAPAPAPATSNVQENKEKLPVEELASKKRSEPEPEPEPAPRGGEDLLDAIRRIFGEPDPKLGEMDILDIAAMKGIHFENPPWHRPGGYDRKPKK